MTVLYCMHCRADVPMLDESEFAALAIVHQQCALAVKRYREENDARLEETPRAQIMQPVLDEYFRLTGHRERDPDHVLKHRISLHGAICGSCGQPLRTSRTSFCASCGRQAN